MKKGSWLWVMVLVLLIMALPACGGGGGTDSSAAGGGGGSGDGGGGGGGETTPTDDGQYEAAPATDYVHVYNIMDIYDPIDLLEDETVTLDDGSVWEVSLYDYRLFMWMDFQDVVVCGLKMFNLDREESVNVFWSGGPMADDCPVYTVSEILEDGELLKLSDGSYWRVSSYDAYETKYWDSVFDDIVITEDQKLINLDDVETVSGTRLN